MRALHCARVIGWLSVAALAAAGSAAAQKLSGEVLLCGEEEFTIQAATKTEIPLSEAPGSITGDGVDSSGKSLELVYGPENKLAVGLFLGPFAGLRMGLEAQWRDDLLAPSFRNFIVTGDSFAAETELDDFTLVHANLSHQIPFAGGRRASRLTFYAENLLDEEPVETLTGVDPRLVGRSFYGGLTVTF